MSANKATYISLFFFLILGIMYWNSAVHLPDFSNQDTISHSYFPILLAVTLVILCLISFVQTLIKKEKKKIDLSNLKLIMITFIFTAVFVLSWSMLGFFYLHTCIYLFGLLTLYRWSTIETKKKLVSVNLLIALSTTLFIYIVFGVVMDLRF